jgi:hypothetical protein
LLEAIPEIIEKFVQVEWYDFCNTFQGHHAEVAMTFKNNFDGFQTQIGDLIIQVSEHSISSAFKLPISGERWFKKKEVPTDLCNKFLVADHQDPEWSKGIPNTWLKEEWKNTLPVVQKYITCEGRFSIVHRYLMRFLLHLNGSSIMNLPYYLLKSHV